MSAGRADRRRGRSGDGTVPSVQVLHREMHAGELATGYRQVALLACTDGEHESIEFLR
jgi:hypothetical protein